MTDYRTIISLLKKTARSQRNAAEGHKTLALPGGHVRLDWRREGDQSHPGLLALSFSSCALDLLERLPNPYWFWAIVLRAAKFVDDAPRQIDAFTVNQVTQFVRKQVAANIDRDIDLIPDDEFAELLGLGVVLVSAEGQRSYNPVFLDPVFEPVA